LRMNKHRSSAPIIPSYAKVILFGQNVSIPSGDLSRTKTGPKAFDQDGNLAMVPKNRDPYFLNLRNESSLNLVKQDKQAIGHPMQSNHDRYDNFKKINIKLDFPVKGKANDQPQAKKSLPKLYSESLLKKYSQKVFDLQEKFKAMNLENNLSNSQKIESTKRNNVKDMVLKTEGHVQSSYSIKYLILEEEGVNSISKRVPIDSHRLTKNSSSRLRAQTRGSEFRREPLNKTFKLSNKNFEDSRSHFMNQESVYVNMGQTRRKKSTLTTEESLLHEEGISTLETELKSHREIEKSPFTNGANSLKISQKFENLTASATTAVSARKEGKNFESLEHIEDAESLSDFCHDATEHNFVTDKLVGIHHKNNILENKSSGHTITGNNFNPMQTNYANFERNVVSLKKLKASITKAGLKPSKKSRWVNQSNPFKKSQDLSDNNQQNNSFEKGKGSYARLLQTMYSQGKVEEDNILEQSRDQEAVLQKSWGDASAIVNNQKIKFKLVKTQNPSYVKLSRKKFIVGAEPMITDHLSILDKSHDNSETFT